ncbi:CPBP family intramembrane glutamic endopeptidase [Amycolatopsis minnesotensis]|uniref:CPBP family intramembrane metalloprotease n=1 Tax=Amycolatopsis minnesotensis TaxID=337894 RepID=A0ABN2QPE5_9PSEU
MTAPHRRGIAIAVAVLLLAAATYLPNRVLPGWAYPVSGAVAAVLLLALASWAGAGAHELGLDRRYLKRSALAGLVGVAVVAVVFGIALVTAREVFEDGRVGRPGVGQLLVLALVRIPFGTVLVEEVAFRGVLPALFGGGERWRWTPVLCASALFGLWHLLPSLALRENPAVRSALGGVPWLIPVAAMLAAAAVGVLLCWWRYTGRGLLTTVLIHLATNSGGLVLAWWVLTRG